jgi:hypothetical protein
MRALRLRVLKRPETPGAGQPRGRLILPEGTDQLSAPWPLQRGLKNAPLDLHTHALCKKSFTMRSHPLHVGEAREKDLELLSSRKAKMITEIPATCEVPVDAEQPNVADNDRYERARKSNMSVVE